MKRKDFVQLTAFTAVAISFPLLDSCKSPASDEAMAQLDFLSRLFDEQTIKKTGESYMQKIPAEKNRGKLVQLLADNDPIVDSADERAIQQYLEEKIKKDFEEGNTVMVNGWVLAVTEARQCALFSLIRT